MSGTWIQIASETQHYRVELLRQKLEDEGIAVMVVNKQDSSYLFGEIEIRVKGENVIKAKHICKDFFE